MFLNSIMNLYKPAFDKLWIFTFSMLIVVLLGILRANLFMALNKPIYHFSLINTSGEDSHVDSSDCARYYTVDICGGNPRQSISRIHVKSTDSLVSVNFW
jgi:hypothetical protein